MIERAGPFRQQDQARENFERQREKTRANAAVTKEREENTVLRQEVASLGFDPLTGVLSRGKCEADLRGLFDQLYGEQKQSGQGRFSVLFVDLDKFKEINDTFGHGQGDTVLRAVAHVLQIGVREDDIVGRWGGEEFIVVLRGATERMAAEKAEELRNKIGQLSFDGQPDLKVTASFGVAEAERTRLRTFDDLVTAADESMYFSKDAGRNRVTTESRRETEVSRQGGLDFGDTGKMNS